MTTDDSSNFTGSEENWYKSVSNETHSVLSGSGEGESENNELEQNPNHNFENGSDAAQPGESLKLPDVFTKVSPGAWPIIYAYAIVFIVAAVGNLTEFVYVWRRLRRRSTVMNRLLLHLCIADIVVVFMVAAVEVFWRISIGWYVGDFLCKLVQYFRAFSLYLSSLMLACLSLDRYYAVVYPLRAMDASRRVKIMLTITWTTAAICAAPQCIVFRVQSHPDFPAFRQCNSIVSGVLAESINTAISISFMYFLPIILILFSYGNIISTLARESDATNERDNNTRFLRRSGASLMDRAKIKALKLSFVIMLSFLLCTSPYAAICIWHIVDRHSAENLNPYIQEALFIMVVANSSVNPLVYGIFNTKRSHHNRQRTQSAVSRNLTNGNGNDGKRRTMIVQVQNRASAVVTRSDAEDAESQKMQNLKGGAAGPDGCSGYNSPSNSDNISDSQLKHCRNKRSHSNHVISAPILQS